MKINSNEIEQYSYAKYIYELRKLCFIHKINMEVIGHKVFDKIKQSYPLYRITINPTASKRICIISGVHGYEIAGVLSFLEIFSNPKKLFNDDISYRIYPCINPTAFDLRQRMNDFSVDLNELTWQSLKSKKYMEVKTFYEDVKNWSMDIFLSMHEDVSMKEFYAYVFEEKEEPVYRKIISKRKKDPFGVLKKKKIYGDVVSNSLIINVHDNSLEDYLFTNKMVRLSICTETPGLLLLKDRIKMNIDNIKILSNYLIK